MISWAAGIGLRLSLVWLGQVANGRQYSIARSRLASGQNTKHPSSAMVSAELGLDTTSDAAETKSAFWGGQLAMSHCDGEVAHITQGKPDQLNGEFRLTQSLEPKQITIVTVKPTKW